MIEVNQDWVENPPSDIESQVFLLDKYGHLLKDKTPTGETLRYIFNEAKLVYQEALNATRIHEPQAFYKPSYEQSMLLNAWVWGFNFPICFAANRIGKTSAFVFNGILWIFPNNPQWLCFTPYTDEFNREVEIIPRPPLSNLIAIQRFFEEYPELQGDPYHSPTHPSNITKWEQVLKLAANLYDPAWPKPPMQRGGTIWLGAPDNEFHKSIIMRRWRELLPKSSILKDSETDRKFIVTTASSTNPKTTAHEIICKSYESEDTKWSGDAVQGIILTEGFLTPILNEVKNRITNEGFASWDYTPAEPRNTGRKVALAYKVFKGEEQLPLRNFVFTKFSVRNAPSHIIPKEKKQDLIRMWDGTSEGKARLDGDFFSSSGLVLDKLNRDFHCLVGWDLNRLQAEYPNGHLYRGLDPGRDHPCACVWSYLSTNNIHFIYRVYSKRGTTISERCKDIIRLSNNTREREQTRNNQIFYREVHSNPNSEVITLTAADYHVFKEDEISGQNYAINYNREGLIITPSITMGPEDRGQKANSLLDPNAHKFLAHPERQVPPAARIFFLTDMPGVANCLDKFDQIFWDRYKAGEQMGEPKDKIQEHGDDELDAMCYIVCAPFIWTPYQPKRREPKENLEQEVATLQFR